MYSKILTYCICKRNQAKILQLMNVSQYCEVDGYGNTRQLKTNQSSEDKLCESIKTSQYKKWLEEKCTLIGN